MIADFESFKDWALYSAKLTTPLQVEYHTRFCEQLTPEAGVTFWKVHAEMKPVDWSAIFGRSP